MNQFRAYPVARLSKAFLVASLYLGAPLQAQQAQEVTLNFSHHENDWQNPRDQRNEYSSAMDGKTSQSTIGFRWSVENQAGDTAGFVELNYFKTIDKEFEDQPVSNYVNEYVDPNTRVLTTDNTKTVALHVKLGSRSYLLADLLSRDNASSGNKFRLFADYGVVFGESNIRRDYRHQIYWSDTIRRQDIEEKSFGFFTDLGMRYQLENGFFVETQLPIFRAAKINRKSKDRDGTLGLARTTYDEKSTQVSFVPNFSLNSLVFGLGYRF